MKFIHIIPNQKIMLKEVEAGIPHDPLLAIRAKQRSRHNNYFTFPVIFIMLSSHFPSTYGVENNWLILITVFVAGGVIKHFLNIKNEFKTTKNFSIDYRSSNLESLQKSEFIITDNSTIGIEFALVLKRNVIYIDYQKKIHNKNFFRFKKESLEEIFRRNIGTSIPISKLEKLGVILSNLKINRDYFIKLNNFEKKYLYNEKKAINKAIDFLLNK